MKRGWFDPLKGNISTHEEPVHMFLRSFDTLLTQEATYLDMYAQYRRCARPLALGCMNEQPEMALLKAIRPPAVAPAPAPAAEAVPRL